MSLESKNLKNIFSLVDKFQDLCINKTIRVTYEAKLNIIEIEISDTETYEILKQIKYKIERQEDLDELENILEMYVQKEEE